MCPVYIIGLLPVIHRLIYLFIVLNLRHLRYIVLNGSCSVLLFRRLIEQPLMYLV